ncbi:hypothetical protein A9Q97_04230 [Rhodospirillales bacterium 47_12_T64]|nr:hypothetical protein A9Q97_04230 [Rhodospirillales bacterium 47_12_T64]
MGDHTTAFIDSPTIGNVCFDLDDWGALFTTGRDHVAGKAEAEGKAMKQMINTQWIYPPSAASTPEEIFAFVSFEQEGKAA